MIYHRKVILIFAIMVIACSPKSGHRPIKGPITESIYAIGIVKSDLTYELKLGVLSAVKKYFVKEGDVVKIYQRLITDDSGTIYKAPFAGVITHLPFSIEETVAPNQSILSLVNLKELYLEASLEQQGALRVRKGQKVQISFESFRTEVFHGVVKNVLPRNNEFVVQVEVKDLPDNILPGMNADLSIEVMKKNLVTLVPMAAISNGHLLIKKGKDKVKIAVVMGVSDSEYVEILSPELSTNDEIYFPKDSKK